MKAAFIGLVVMTFPIAIGAAAAQQPRQDPFARAYEQCLSYWAENISNKEEYCSCMAGRDTRNRTPRQCMQENSEHWTYVRHPPGFAMLYCTETWKRSDAPDRYDIRNSKYFFLRLTRDQALFCPSFPSSYAECFPARIEEPDGVRRIIADGGNVFTMNPDPSANPPKPPNHRLQDSFRDRSDNVTRTVEGPCQVFGNDEKDWPDQDIEPRNTTVANVCTQAGGPSYCVPGRYVPADPAFIDKARIRREDTERTNRVHANFLACTTDATGQMPDQVRNIYCMCLNGKMGQWGTTALLEWARTNPQARAQCRSEADAFVASHPR